MIGTFQKYKANKDGSDFYGACQLRQGFIAGIQALLNRDFSVKLLAH